MTTTSLSLMIVNNCTTMHNVIKIVFKAFLNTNS